MQKMNSLKKYLLFLFLLSGGAILAIIDGSKIERRAVTISCNKWSIQSYLNDGWTVENSNTRQVKCGQTFKSVCFRLDSVGCAATRSKSVDVIGTEVEYIISRKSRPLFKVISSITKNAVEGISSIPKKAVDAWDSVDNFIVKNITHRENKY